MIDNPVCKCGHARDEHFFRGGCLRCECEKRSETVEIEILWAEVEKLTHDCDQLKKLTILMDACGFVGKTDERGRLYISHGNTDFYPPLWEQSSEVVNP